MALEVTRLAPSEFEDGVDFINLVFSQNSVPHDFKNLMPKWVCPEHTADNVVVKRDGRIRSLVMSAPMQAVVAGYPLSCFGIGNVSTHLDERKTGLMRMAMTRALDDMQADGADFAFLGGHRQRYGYYGFERCGHDIACTLSSRNIRHARVDAPAYTYAVLEGFDDPALPAVRALYEAQPVRVLRGDDRDFYRSLIMWRNTPYICREPDGAFAGYLCVSADRTRIAEVFAADESRVLGILQGWMERHNLETLSLNVFPWRRVLLRDITRICDGVSIVPDHQYRIFHWDRVVGAFLALKARFAPLPDGELVLGIADWGNLSVRLQGGRTEAAKTDREACVTLAAFDAMRVLFGPQEPGMVAELPGDAEKLLHAWCPLPLSWNSLDNV